MPKAPKPAFYAVAKGRQTGIFSSWPECESQVKGFVGAVHKKFPSRSQAQDFLDAAGKGRNAGESYQAAAKAAAAATAPKSRPAASKTDMSRQSSGRVAKRRDSETSASSHHSVDDVTSDALRSLQAKGFAVDRNRLVVWTDGASKDNGKRIARAGVGVFWGKRGDAGRINVAERLPGLPQTNNRAELLAIIRALETCPDTDVPLEIRTDSQYSISCLTAYLPGWLRNDFRTRDGGDVKNKDLLVHLMTLLERRGPENRVKFTYVKAHVGIDGNEAADRLACDGSAIEPIPTRRNWLTLDDLARAGQERKRVLVHGPTQESDADSGVGKADQAQADIEFEIDPDWLLSEAELAKLDETQDF